MYESHFGLQEAPFALTPNTRYFLRAPSHSESLELLLVALRQREGFIKVLSLIHISEPTRPY